MARDDSNDVEEPLSPQPPPEEVEVLDATYGVDSLAAVLRPVMVTMLLASLAVVYVRDPTASATGSGVSSYLVFSDSSTASGGGGSAPSGGAIGEALINALVIVGVVCGATFALVLCYYFNLTRLMTAYLALAMTMLLGYSGGTLVYTAIGLWRVSIDWVTFAVLMFNFSAVGVFSIFWQRGVPRSLTQMYLVCVSVIMAWNLTKLPEWTSWALLVMLALYDLCAVLTPCGPLKALIALVQERQVPLPGLLYEASVGGGEERGWQPAVATGRAPPGAGAVPAAAEALHGPPTAVVGAGNATVIVTVPQEEEEEEEAGGIKLGLGDFVFYSVLVSRAALYDASTFAACFVAVVCGLGGTLVLLTVARKALPALPISILLGVVGYLATRFALTPMLAELVLRP
jgi:presenilin 1